MSKPRDGSEVALETVCLRPSSSTICEILSAKSARLSLNCLIDLMILKNKSAVITGCNRGIGKSILETFVKNGADIWACVRKPSKDFSYYLDNLREKTKSRIEEIYFDLSDSEQVKIAGKKIISTNKPVDILVNNAGAIHTALFQMTDINKIKEIFEINFFSQILFTQYILKISFVPKSLEVNINLGSLGKGVFFKFFFKFKKDSR